MASTEVAGERTETVPRSTTDASMPHWLFMKTLTDARYEHLLN